METNPQMQALLHLLDDPDEEIYATVSTHIIAYGKQIIPNLENLWENTPDQSTQERIEMLIHRLHLQELQSDLTDWQRHCPDDLLTGVLLVSRYQYPDLNLNPIRMELEKIKRSIWLELNSYLTALEQVNVLNSILFNYFKFKGGEVNYTKPDEFLLHRLLESKQGNAINTGILMLIISEMLGLNLRAIQIPRQFILAWMNPADEEFPIQFYVDSANGQIYSQKDVDTYFKRVNATAIPSYFEPMQNERILQLLLEEYSKCFTDESNSYKGADLRNLAALLNR